MISVDVQHGALGVDHSAVEAVGADLGADPAPGDQPGLDPEPAGHDLVGLAQAFDVGRFGRHELLARA
ncbi:hypothetical protein ACFY9S_40255 [Streptomyces sp. NPDC012474]|uniref:hypothetical protein n=1 Tax=Streptomyces sp. NPDC012474 TaxID=3364836 RepID=UPI0036EF04D9